MTIKTKVFDSKSITGDVKDQIEVQELCWLSSLQEEYYEEAEATRQSGEDWGDSSEIWWQL